MNPTVFLRVFANVYPKKSRATFARAICFEEPKAPHIRPLHEKLPMVMIDSISYAALVNALIDVHTELTTFGTPKPETWEKVRNIVANLKESP